MDIKPDEKIKMELTAEVIQITIQGLSTSELPARIANEIIKIFGTAVKNHQDMKEIQSKEIKKGKGRK